MQKGFAALLLLIAVLVIGGVGAYIYLNQTSSKDIPFQPSDQKETLKIYQNEKLGFQFEYNNKIFKVQEDSEDEFNKRGNGDFRKNFTYYVTYQPAEVLGIVVVLDESNSYETNPLTIWVFNNPNNLTIEKWYLNFWYYPFVWGDYTERRNNVAPINEATISGQIAKSGVVDYQPSSPRFIYLSRNDKMYLFRIIGQVGNQILSTFKLLQ